MVLDDAADAAQVRPLLPGGSSSAVLLTSRAMLATLDGVVHQRVDALSESDALALLTHLVGEERMAAEPEAAAGIVAQCGGLPLAVRVVGARLMARPEWSVRGLADRLADEQDRLDELERGDLAVRGLAVSYEALRHPTLSLDGRI